MQDLILLMKQKISGKASPVPVKARAKAEIRCNYPDALE